MLTLPEKIIFIVIAIASLYGAYLGALRIIRTVRRGHGEIPWKEIPTKLGSIFIKIFTFQPVFRIRLLPSLFHGLVAWGFLYYLVVNLSDLLKGYYPDFNLLGTNRVNDLYRLGADLVSVAILLGIIALMLRRFIIQPASLSARQDILLHPKARSGIRRDSAIVSSFVLIHVGSRFLGESFRIAANGSDIWQPFASKLALLWHGWSPLALLVSEHITFWLALGSVLIFIPYFLYSKHLHLIMTPINFLLKPQRRSIGELGRLDFEDERIEQFGVLKLEQLGWEQIMDAYACIMCYRCQQVCPAYHTGKELSPAALEINKRYYLNAEGARLARGQTSRNTLLDFAITPEAVWACTACGACIEICPVGNEPMRDILDIRRALVLMENDFPEQLQTAFRGMERSSNPWNIPPAERLKWAEGLPVPTITQNPAPDILWWVGCASATDARAQKIARAFAQILSKAGINYAILGEQEQCTGDSARRAGNEYLFHELATANVELLNHVAPTRIVTTCPHCLHTIKNEYPAFGGHYPIVHHSQLIAELFASGQLHLNSHSNFSNRSSNAATVTFHDPCYLGRHNKITHQPRQVLEKTALSLVEMPAHGKLSFCCGAGGAQMWKEEEHGSERVNTNRFRQAQGTHADILAVGCPFCLIMLTDAGKAAQSTVQVLDIAEIMLQWISD